jgi:putative addiction module killer protein
MQKLSVILFTTKNGKEPLVQWLNSLKNKKDRAGIQRRIQYIENGNLGDYKYIGDGVYELRFFFSSGYRVYFAKDDVYIILLLCGGDKSSQTKDIKKAKEYLKEYLEEKYANKRK